MEASVCYDDGIPPVAKFTEKEIHIIVRHSQTLPMGMFVYVSAHQLVYISVCACVCLCVGVSGQRGWWACTPLIREDYHLREHILFVFVLPSVYHRVAYYASWVMCSCVCGGACVVACVYVCIKTHSYWWTNKIDRLGWSVKPTAP